MAADNSTPNEEPLGGSILAAALQACAAGLSVLPPTMDGTKKPSCAWKQYQEATASEEQVRKWYANGHTGLGLVTGAVSGNLELFEFDDYATYEAFKRAAEACGLGDLVRRIEAGYCEATPKPGIHLLYRCSEISGNTKLAKAGKQVLIETRGEAGFVITAPSHGKVHPSGKPYLLRSGGFDTITTITPEERQDLFDLACSFDVPPSEAVEEPRQQKAGNDNVGLRPGDNFNARADWRGLLEGRALV